MMGRGKTAAPGATRVSQNGYHYTKAPDHPRSQNGWILTHWLTAEKKIGRPIAENEIVKFIDPKYKRDPYNEEGIVIIKKKTTSLRRRKAVIEARIEELQAELKFINKELDKL